MDRGDTMNTITVQLKDYRYIETWDEFDRFIEHEYPGKEGYEKLLKIDEFKLDQNTCDGRRYTLRCKSKEDAIKAWNIHYELEEIQ